MTSGNLFLHEFQEASRLAFFDQQSFSNPFHADNLLVILTALTAGPGRASKPALFTDGDSLGEFG
jgi:hypothetical protein